MVHITLTSEFKDSILKPPVPGSSPGRVPPPAQVWIRVLTCPSSHPWVPFIWPSSFRLLAFWHLFKISLSEGETAFFAGTVTLPRGVLLARRLLGICVGAWKKGGSLCSCMCMCLCKVVKWPSYRKATVIKEAVVRCNSLPSTIIYKPPRYSLGRGASQLKSGYNTLSAWLFVIMHYVRQTVILISDLDSS
jgi:hypothetical protein